MLNSFLCIAQIDNTIGIWDVYEDNYLNYIHSMGVLDSRNGYKLSPTGQIRFLVAFIELEYHNPANDPSLGGTTEWPVGQLPAWKDDLLEYNVPTGQSTKHLTKYFQMASSNSLIVLGDYLVAPDNGGVFKIQTIDGVFQQPDVIIHAINQKIQMDIVLQAISHCLVIVLTHLHGLARIVLFLLKSFVMSMHINY